MNAPPPITLEPQAPDLRNQISGLPQGAGIYCLAPEGGPPHLAWSANLHRRLRRMLIGSEQRGELAASRIRFSLERVDCWHTTSKLESALLMYQLARQLFPADYAKRLRLRLPWFVATADSEGFPRLAVTNGRGRRYQSLWGPFASKDAAEFYQQEVLRLHQVRRCSEPLQPSPEHPGCIYGEMSQCLRPCQGAVSRQEYQTEFARLSDFIGSNGKSVLARLTAARTSASENLDFEQAALIHKRLEQVKAAIGAREDFITEMRDFNGVAITGGSSRSEVRLWPMLGSYWQEPIRLDVSAEQAQSRSLDSDLKTSLRDAASAAITDGDPFEHLSLFLRWFGSSWRDGTWLPFSSLASFNYRRLVRDISKLAKESA